MNLHKVRITIPDSRAVLTRIYVDGEELRGVTAVGFRVDMEHNAVLTLELFADIEIEGEAEIIKAWRRWKEAGDLATYALPPADPTLIGTEYKGLPERER